MSITDEKYVSFTTFRRNGERKSLPVWIVPVDGGAGFTTGSQSWKLKRLRNDPRCELQPCNGRGAVTEGSIVVTGMAREATAEEHQRIQSAVSDKYGFTAKLVKIPAAVQRLFGKDVANGNTSIVIALD